MGGRKKRREGGAGGGREGGREGGEGGRDGGKEGRVGREGRREGGREGWDGGEGRRDGGRDGGREGRVGREGRREREKGGRDDYSIFLRCVTLQISPTSLLWSQSPSAAVSNMQSVSPDSSLEQETFLMWILCKDSASSKKTPVTTPAEKVQCYSIIYTSH